MIAVDRSSVAGLVEVLPAGVVQTDPDVLAGYAADMASLVPAGSPLAVVRPTNTAEVSATMAWAHAHGVVVHPRGAGTGLSGGATASDGAIVLSLERMTTIRAVDPLNQTVVVEAGVVNADVGAAVAEHGLFYPPDPGSYEVCTIGGNVATNAGGMRCVKYGVTRQSVLGLEVVLADGRVFHAGGSTVKNVAGLNLTQLMIGSEGTLGVITAATLRLRPKPAGNATFVATFPTLDAGTRALNDLFATDITPSMLEILDNNTINAVEDHQRMDLDRDAALLLIGQTDGADAAADAARIVALCDAAGASLSMATDDPDEFAMLLQARRLSGWVVMETHPTMIEDVAVPRTRLGELLTRIAQIGAQVGIEICTVGHAGDGNLHPMLILDGDDGPARAQRAADLICAAAIALDGTVTGEHGVGTLKRDHALAQLDEVSVDVQRSIKRALDPTGILNPGRGY